MDNRNFKYENSAQNPGSARYSDSPTDTIERSFLGKGPKSYRRADRRIYEDVCEVLSDHPHIDASDIEVSVNEGHVTLKGTVNSKATKRMAEDIIENCFGVIDIHNQLFVNNQSIRDQGVIN